MNRLSALKEIEWRLIDSGIDEISTSDIIEKLEAHQDNVIEAFRLKLRGLKHKEIAYSLGISEARVSTIFSQTLRAVRESLRVAATFRTFRESQEYTRTPRSQDIDMLYLAYAWDAYGDPSQEAGEWLSQGSAVDLRRYERDSEKS